VRNNRDRDEPDAVEERREKVHFWNMRIGLFTAAALLTMTGTRAIAEPSPAATAAFDLYVAHVEARLAEQHRSQNRFVQPPLSSGEVTVERLDPGAASHPPGAIIHHWRATAFAPSARAPQLEQLLRDFANYPKYFAPQALSARVLSSTGDSLQGEMRVRQKHVITVVLDGVYDVTFGGLDSTHRYSLSRSARISEVEASGTDRERTLGPDQDHGFLWRLNTYWTWQERNGGLDVQIESVSLTRSIPAGLGWVIGPYIQSIPKDSLAFTLQSAIRYLKGESQ